MEKNLVSVIIPTYKRTDTILRAIYSVLNQTYSHLEAIVVNDNEPSDKYTAHVKELIKSVTDTRLKFIIQKQHMNGAAARNAGIRIAEGEYIAFLDDDDLWMPHKLELQVNLLKKMDNSWGGVGCQNFAIHKNKVIRANLPYKDGLIYEDILLRNADVSTDAVVLRRNALDEMGYFDENLNRHQEVQLMGRFTSKYKLKLLNKYLVCVDIGDVINRPKPSKLWELKLDFFKSMEDIIETLPKNHQRRIYIMHQFELGGYEFKNGFFLKGLVNILCIVKSPVTLYYGIKKIVKRYIAGKFCKSLVNKDVKMDSLMQILKVGEDL